MRFNLIPFVLVLVLVFGIRIVWGTKDEDELEDDDEVDAVTTCKTSKKIGEPRDGKNSYTNRKRFRQS